MNVVLLADNLKNELLVNFCIAYSSILNRQRLFSPANTAKLIINATKLGQTALAVDSDISVDQLAAHATYNEIDAVIYLRDPLRIGSDSVGALLLACDTNNIPVATNLAAAEILVLAIDRGDLDWRQLLHEAVQDGRSSLAKRT